MASLTIVDAGLKWNGHRRANKSKRLKGIFPPYDNNGKILPFNKGMIYYSIPKRSVVDEKSNDFIDRLDWDEWKLLEVEIKIRRPILQNPLRKNLHYFGQANLSRNVHTGTKFSFDFPEIYGSELFQILSWIIDDQTLQSRYSNLVSILEDLDQICLHLSKVCIESCLRGEHSLENEDRCCWPGMHDCHGSKFAKQFIWAPKIQFDSKPANWHHVLFKMHPNILSHS